MTDGMPVVAHWTVVAEHLLLDRASEITHSNCPAGQEPGEVPETGILTG